MAASPATIAKIQEIQRGMELDVQEIKRIESGKSSTHTFTLILHYRIHQGIQGQAIPRREEARK